MNYPLNSLIEPVVELAKEAGRAILELYQSQGDMEIQVKSDASPVTKADYKAHNIIQAGLTKITPDLPILSEEAADISYQEREKWREYWLVDPLDGTKEFIHRTDEFTVNIALVVDHKAVIGVIYVPVYDACYFAVQDQGAYKAIGNNEAITIHTRPLDIDNIVTVVSRRHGSEWVQTFLSKINSDKIIKKGSSLKSCTIAEGLADVYPCLGPTSEWDMAAAQCIINEAGGKMFDTEMLPILFNTKDSLINPELLVVGDASYDWARSLEE